MADQNLAELYQRKPVKSFSGLYARTRRDGGKTYYLETRAGWLNLGRDKKEAIRRYDQERPRARKGEDVVAPSRKTFETLAAEWLARRRHELDTRTTEHYEWALEHLLPYFGSRKLSEIKAAHIKSFMAAKLSEREERDAAIEAWGRADPKTRGRKPKRGLSNSSINKLLKVLAMILDDEPSLEENNPARGKRVRLKAGRPKRTWLQLHEINVLLDCARIHRALLATMILAGLRVSELTSLRWREVDLPGARLRVTEAKTEAGVRTVDISPMLRDELAIHRADSQHTGPDNLVFGTSAGTERNRSNITRQILQPTIERANFELAKAGKPRIEGLTNHSLRRTFASLLYHEGRSPRYVMKQLGHTDPALALAIYADVIGDDPDFENRDRDSLIREADFRRLESALEG